jgi:hypothetical protein
VVSKKAERARSSPKRHGLSSFSEIMCMALLELREIAKNFGAMEALKGVDLYL